MSERSETKRIPHPIRVVLVDDQALFRAGIRMLVDSQPDLEVVGEAYDIAAYYLNKTGVLADRGMINDQLLEAIYKLFNSGIRNRLLLANKAISKFERAWR